MLAAVLLHPGNGQDEGGGREQHDARQIVTTGDAGGDNQAMAQGAEHGRPEPDSGLQEFLELVDHRLLGPDDRNPRRADPVIEVRNRFPGRTGACRDSPTPAIRRQQTPIDAAATARLRTRRRRVTTAVR